MDGTLYPNYQLYIRLIPFIVRKFPLLLALNKARIRLRSSSHEEFPPEKFYDIQAVYMAESLNLSPPQAKQQLEQLVYRGWEPLFTSIPLFDGVRECLQIFRDSGIKLGILSDFPPEKKIRNLGIADFFDVLLCSEIIGRLKPNPLPFITLARYMELPPEQILYVGNSVPYDIIGAKGVGMQTALILPGKKRKSGNRGNADFIFSSYRQLSTFVIPL